MKVFVNNKQNRVSLELGIYRKLLRKLLKECRVTGEVGLTFVDDEAIRKLNRQYRQLDRPTDVLSFAMREGEKTPREENLLGDIVVSVETAQRQAKEYQPDLNETEGLTAELSFLIIHGFLHLAGYDHQSDDDALIMKKRERELLSPNDSEIMTSRKVYSG
ncbi:MAG: rRNA maturation RNase YbeY [bacterium]